MSTPTRAFPAYDDLRTAWSLHILDASAAHGYDIARRLGALALASELAAVYRTLRRLEREGCVSSCLTPASTGPNRRVYRLTPRGRRELDVITARIATTLDLEDGFLRAYQRASSSARHLGRP